MQKPIRLKNQLRITRTKELMEMMNLQDRTESNLLGASACVLDPKIQKVAALFQMFGLDR
jgi:K+-transporting ATPase c subunit